MAATLALCAALCFATAAGQVATQTTDTYCWGEAWPPVWELPGLWPWAAGSACSAALPLGVCAQARSLKVRHALSPPPLASGWNDHGELGNGQVGSTSKTAAPTLVVGGEDLKTVSAGGEVTCGLRASNSTAVCW